jgi:cell division septal protein FtsQ
MNWFNRKPKNKRLVRAHVLDVKLRSDQVRASRARLTAATLAVTFVTVFGFYAIWRAGEFALDRLVYHNPSFAIQEIDVRTDGVIAPGQLRRWAGVQNGGNLLALDLPRVKHDLEAVSMIKSVAVERVLPHTLRLRVTERDALAQIQVLQTRTNGAIVTNRLNVDADGFVMTLLAPNQRALPVVSTNGTLPMIAGLNENDLAPGRRLDAAQARSALQLISAFEHSTMAGLVDLETIDVSEPEVLQVRTAQGSVVTFSLADFDRDLRRWRTIYDQGQRFGKVIATLDLSVPNSIPVAWTDAAGAPHAIPGNQNLQHNPKQHV